MEYLTRETVQVAVRCDKCGSDNVSIPETEGSSDAITCNDCGADLGTRAALDEQVAKEIGQQLEDKFEAMLREAFEGSPNVRISKS